MYQTRPTISFGICLVIVFVNYNLPAVSQNCEVDFPGVALRNFSNTCGGSSVGDLELGKSINMNNGDTFTFDAPAVINITGNLHVDAEGSGKIIIPVGVTVNIDDDFHLHSKNGGCTSANPCVFEIVVNGTLNIDHNFDNELFTLVWSGTGTVTVDDNFKNSNNGCLDCGPSGCPNIQADPSDCDDDGSGCSGGDFCAQINNPCSSETTLPVIAGCPSNQVINMTGPGCIQIVSWNPPTASDNCNVSSFTWTHAPGTPFPKGETTVTYTARDPSGNTVTCSFTVNVVDNLAAVPIISNCPIDIVLKGNEANVATADWVIPTASVPCGEVILTGSHQPGEFQVGTTKIEYTATDEAGNSSYCSFNVIVSEREIEIDIGNVVTPDDNGLNDVWHIGNLETFKDNEVDIVDRWGGLIFSATNYDNVKVAWGGTNLSGGQVPTGTYFYLISIKSGSKRLEKRGFIELIR